MATISSITTHVGNGGGSIGLRRAVMTRRALLGDCATVGENVRAFMTRGYWQRPGCVVPLGRRPRREPSAADLALRVARQLVERVPADAALRVGALIYCHETPDAKLSESTVGRLQFELGLRDANPFSISQAHNAGLWIALDLALGLLDGPEDAQQVLLVASDKQGFGGPSADPRRLAFEDVAAAALVSRSNRAAGAGWRIEQVAVRRYSTASDAHAAWPAQDVAAFAAFGANVLRAALDEAHVRIDGLHGVIATTSDGAFASTLHAAAGLPSAMRVEIGPKRSRARRRGASSADLLLSLACVERSVPVGGRLLAWSAGNNGEFACCVLQRV